MELWIKSQDGEILVKVNNLSLVYDTNTWEIINSYEDHQYWELGTYTTKERALEILNEIQRILQPKIIINNTSDDSLPIIDGEWVKSIKAEMNYDTKELSTVVYEMPKE